MFQKDNQLNFLQETGEKKQGKKNRRRENNQRERRRISTINASLRKLAHVCKIYNQSDAPISKLEILNQTADAIENLEKQIRERNLSLK